MGQVRFNWGTQYNVFEIYFEQLKPFVPKLKLVTIVYKDHRIVFGVVKL